jgi:hypothetical protein
MIDFLQKESAVYFFTGSNGLGINLACFLRSSVLVCHEIQKFKEKIARIFEYFLAIFFTIYGRTV